MSSLFKPRACHSDGLTNSPQEEVYSRTLHYELYPLLSPERSPFVRIHHVFTYTLAYIPLATSSTLHLKRSKINIRRRIPTHYRVPSRDRRSTRRI